MKKASEILSSFLDEAQLEKARNYSSFFRSWRSIAGIDIGSHSRVKEIERDLLIIECDHPGWAQMIGLKKRGFLKEIRSRYPELGIRDIRVWTVKEFSEPREEEPVRPATAVSPEDEDREVAVRGRAAEDPVLVRLLSSIGREVDRSAEEH